MEIQDRINLIIEREGLSIAAFARKLGIGDQTVRSVCILRRNKPGYDFLAKIVQTFEWLNPTWLLTGEGDMVAAYNADQADSAATSNLSLKEIVEYLREKDTKIESLIEERAILRMEIKGLYNRRTNAT